MLKKLARIFIWMGLVFGIIILITLLIVRIKLPPYKIKQLAIAELETALNREVKIGKVWFNPFRGFTINDVVIAQRAPNDSASTDTTFLFRTRQIQLKYRLLALLKRAIEINNIVIDQPEVNLKQDQHGRWNVEDLIALDTTAIQPTSVDTGAFEFSLSFSINLKKFSLNNFIANFYIDQVDTVYTIRSGGLSFRIDDLYLPRQPFDQLKNNARAAVRLFSDEQPWEFMLNARASSEITELSSILQLDIKVNYSGINLVKSEGKLGLTNLALNKGATEDRASFQQIFSLPKFASMMYALNIDAEKGDLTLNHLTAQLGEETLFDIKGKITNFIDQPLLDLAVVESDINLENIISLMMPLLPDTIQQQRKQISIRGLASLKGSKVSGNPLSNTIAEALTADLVFSVDDFHVKYVDPNLNLMNLKIRSKVSEVHNIDGVRRADIWIDAALDSFYLAVDTLQLGYSGLTLNLQAALNSSFMPDSIVTQATIKNFFEVPLNLSFNFKSIDGLDRFLANGNLSIDQLPLWNLPESPLDGLIDIAMNLRAETLDRISLNMKVASDIIEVQTETEPMIFYPLNIFGDAILATDKTFQVIKLTQLKMKVNNFASALMHGDFKLETPQQLNLFIDEFNIDHEKVMPILPAQLLEGIESLKVTGESKLTSKISIVLPENQEPIIDANGQILVTAGVEYPDALLSIKSIDGTISFHSDGESGTFDLKAMVDRLTIEDVRDEPLRNMTVFAAGHFPDLETVKLDSSMMIIPDLMTKVFLTGQIDSLSGNLLANLNGMLWFDSEDGTVRMLNDLNISGKLNLRIDLSLLNDIARIRGLLNVEQLNLNYENIAQVDSIVGKIYFTQNYDIEKGTLIEATSNQSFFIEAGSYYYDLLRAQYEQSHDHFSSVRIGKIQAMDYYASDIIVDMFIQNERIEVPRFFLKMYDGNLSGLIYANLHEGEPDQIEWRVKANLSQLNSAKLVSSRRLRAKDSELNMNLELSGVGVDPASKLDMEGYLYVTKIGSQFTDNVLRSLDPKGTDKSIQDTRKLLNWGYKPKLISFEVKHGNLYPTIHLSKGKLLTKLIPLNLSGGKIELARIPVKFFMTNLMTETQ